MNYPIEMLECDTMNANAVKEVVLKKLLEKNIIKQDVYDEFLDEWQIIIVNPNWFKRWAIKFGISDSMNKFMLVNLKPNNK